MSSKIQKKYSVSAVGDLVINSETGAMNITNSETGEVFDLSELLSDFNGREVKIACNYAEDIG